MTDVEKRFVVFRKSFHVGKPRCEIHNGDLITGAIDKQRWNDVIWKKELGPEDAGLSLDELKEKYLNAALVQT